MRYFDVRYWSCKKAATAARGLKLKRSYHSLYTHTYFGELQVARVDSLSAGELEHVLRDPQVLQVSVFVLLYQSASTFEPLKQVSTCTMHPRVASMATRQCLSSASRSQRAYLKVNMMNKYEKAPQE
jgi:hypothetical protein